MYEDSGIFKSACWEGIFRFLERLAPTKATVLFSGEPGTGKDHLAGVLDSMSQSRNFVPVECPSLYGELFNSEVFGVEKGAFTGSMNRIGLIDQAAGGTLLFSDLSDLSLDAQGRMLGLIQRKMFRRVGGVRDMQTTARIMATTNRDLRQMVEAGTFRADLFGRLGGITINVPPLRERSEDILPLIEFYFKKSEFNPGGEFALVGMDSSDALALKQLAWPGNVRDVEHAVDRALLVRSYQTAVLSAEDILRAATIVSAKSTKDGDFQHVFPLENPHSGVVFQDLSSLEDEYIKQKIVLILEVLGRTHWKKRPAARLLNVEYKAFLYQLKVLGIRSNATDFVEKVCAKTSGV